MRIRITLSSTSKANNALPFSYHYPLSAVIYHTIAGGNQSFAEYLHSIGFEGGARTYKLFTFSDLTFPAKGFKAEGDRMLLLCEQLYFDLSFMVPAAAEYFISGVFKNQALEIGDQKSRVRLLIKGVEVLSEPVFKPTMHFRTLSPLVVTRTRANDKKVDYLSPEDPDFATNLLNNLMFKYATALQHKLIEPDLDAKNGEIYFAFNISNVPRSRVETIKAGTPAQTRLKGYTFDFSITAPPALIRTGYMAGFGEKNALGMGCVEERIRGENI
ncbi:MAG: CRISPR-associated endoribonuclease Cas6 [Bacteroidales bacterium]|nr:CRISPR-associated endoribonuclease Cas6 [Bacteroidales bacterium]MDZ4204483.1 CRISPR-associated endoribonuclease Cas6 [Bacteroidales bacterium]